MMQKQIVTISNGVTLCSIQTLEYVFVCELRILWADVLDVLCIIIIVYDLTYSTYGQSYAFLWKLLVKSKSTPNVSYSHFWQEFYYFFFVFHFTSYFIQIHFTIKRSQSLLYPFFCYL